VRGIADKDNNFHHRDTEPQRNQKKKACSSLCLRARGDFIAGRHAAAFPQLYNLVSTRCATSHFESRTSTTSLCEIW